MHDVKPQLCNCAGHDSEVFLVPRAIFKDPFRGGENILVMADCYEPPHEDESGAWPVTAVTLSQFFP
jgi:hypothetical protein